MNYRQTANPNATNSELDAKTILQRGVEDCELPVSLTVDQISTILYVLEGYIQGNDDDKLSDELVGICDKIIEELAPVGAYTDSDYASKVDTLVGNMVASDDNLFTHDSEGC